MHMLSGALHLRILCDSASAYLEGWHLAEGRPALMGGSGSTETLIGGFVIADILFGGDADWKISQYRYPGWFSGMGGGPWPSK